jgi:hypothetical protein
MSAKVAFLSKEVPEAERKPRTVVNPEAVVTRDGSSVVFVVAEGRARAVAVQTAERLGEAVALSGVKPGDKVVLRPEAKLRDGAAVKTAQKP